MIVAQGEEMEPEGEEEDETLCLPPLPTSPPTQIVTMPAMEVSFTADEENRVVPPSGLEPTFLWSELLRMHTKLVHFGLEYQKVRNVLQNWQGKLTVMGQVVTDLHRVQSELIHRFLGVETTVPSEVYALKLQMGEASEMVNELRTFAVRVEDHLQKFQLWRTDVDRLSDLPTKFANSQGEIQVLASRLTNLEQLFQASLQRQEDRWTAYDAQLKADLDLVQGAVHEHISEGIQDFQTRVRAVDQTKVDQVEARVARLELAAGGWGQQVAQLEENLMGRFQHFEQFVADALTSKVTDSPPAPLLPSQGKPKAQRQIPTQFPKQSPVPNWPSSPKPPVQLSSNLPQMLGGDTSLGSRSVQLSPLNIKVEQGASRPVGSEARYNPGTNSGWTVQPPQNFEQETRSRGTSEAGDGEGLSSVGVRAVATVPPLLQPFLAEVLKSHHRKVFMGEPSDFPGWKHAWESFLEACRATSGGMALPDIAVLHLMEGWLDKGSQILLHTRLSERPDLRYWEFFAELCREFEFDSGRGKRNRWRDVHLKLPRGKVTFAEWRNFKLSLEANLAGVETPTGGRPSRAPDPATPPGVERGDGSGEYAPRQKQKPGVGPFPTLDTPGRGAGEDRG